MKKLKHQLLFIIAGLILAILAVSSWDAKGSQIWLNLTTTAMECGIESNGIAGLKLD